MHLAASGVSEISQLFAKRSAADMSTSGLGLSTSDRRSPGLQVTVKAKILFTKGIGEEAGGGGGYMYEGGSLNLAKG